MKQDNHIFDRIFSDLDQVSEDELASMMDGGLSAEEIEAIEQYMTEADLAAGGIENLTGIDGIELDDIESRINARVDQMAIQAQQTESAPVIDFASRTQAQPAATPTKGKRSPFRWMSLAASIVLLAVVSLWLLSPNATLDPDLQSGANYLSSTRRGGENNGLGKALAMYQSQDYSGAVTALEGVETEDGRYLLGLSYLGAEQPAKAVLVLEDLDSTQKREPVEWYLAYAYYKNGQKDKAVALYESIKDKPEGDYSKRAADFLETLQDMN
jgi:hypothetical protein